MTKKDKTDPDQKKGVTDAGSNKEEKKENTPTLDENAIRDRIDRAGQVFKKFSSLLTVP